MNPQDQAEIQPDDIYVRTAEGNAAMDDGGRALSSGFREMLRSLDGVRRVEQLAPLFPRLDSEDITLWLGELRKMRLIDYAPIPFDLPAAKAGTAPASTRATPAPTTRNKTGGLDIDALTANVEQWLMQDTESFNQVEKAELLKTVQQATLQSTQAVAILQNSGFFANLMEPLPVKGRPPVGPPKTAGRKGRVMVYENDPADSALVLRLLNAAGYQAQLAASRTQLLMLLNQPLAPDLVFLKHGGGDVDAFKVLEKLRVHPRLGKAGVIMMAHEPTQEDIAKSMLLGAHGWIAAPYTAAAMVAAIKGATQGNGDGGGAPS